MTSKIKSEDHLGIYDIFSSDQADLALKKSYLIGLGTFILSYFIYFVFIFGTLYFDSLAVKALCSLMSGICLAQIFVIAHDACHDSLTSSSFLNSILARLALLPTLHVACLWELGHNKQHHLFTMLKGKDSACQVPLSKEDYDKLSPFNKLIERFTRTPVGALFSYLIKTQPQVLVPCKKSAHVDKKKYVYDASLMGIYIVFWVSFLTFFAPEIFPETHYVENLIFGFLVPFLIFVCLMSLATYLHHVHPQIPWFDKEEEWSFFKGQIAGSTHTFFPGPMDTVFLNIMYHTAHHFMRSAIPFYRVRMVQEGIERRFPHDVIVQHFTLKKYFEIARICKLYDYENHCWIDFDGSPTTPCLVSKKEKILSPVSN